MKKLKNKHFMVFVYEKKTTCYIFKRKNPFILDSSEKG